MKVNSSTEPAAGIQGETEPGTPQIFECARRCGAFERWREELVREDLPAYLAQSGAAASALALLGAPHD